jgi:cell fate regulator YaaT (PSP1 superfamily)
MACNKLNTYNWLNHMVLPSDFKPFNIVEVRFKGSRKEFYRNEDNIDLYTGQSVVVESDMGHDLGHVSLSGELVRLQLKKAGLREDDKVIRKIYRLSSEKDREVYTEQKAKEPSTLERARTIAMEMKLAMKISDIEFQGDGRKVIFFYTSEERVDFRQLIKQYASEFKTRIEMRQVSYREEASRLGAIGSCGRELCCSTWLTDYKVVSMSTARSQNLSINMLKLSGQCGRLKCCLNYELDTYLEALREFPKNDRLKLETAIGPAYLQKTDILKRMLWFSYPKSTDWVAIHLDRVNEIVELNKNGEKPETLVDTQIASTIIEKVGPAPDLISDQSLNRMDELDAARKKNRNKNKGNRNKKGGFQNRGPRDKTKGGNANPNSREGGQDRNTSNNPKGNKSRSGKKRPNRGPRRPDKPKGNGS